MVIVPGNDASDWLSLSLSVLHWLSFLSFFLSLSLFLLSFSLLFSLLSSPSVSLIEVTDWRQGALTVISPALPVSGLYANWRN